MNLIHQLNDFMRNMGIDYAICGGHAIDLFLGKKTRPHKDLDVMVYWEDRDKIIRHMLNRCWNVYEPCGTAYLHKINDVENQKRIKSNIWCVKQTNMQYKFVEHETDMYAVEFDNTEQIELDYIEFLFNLRQNRYFLYARNNDVKMSLDNAIHIVNGIPYLAPEIVLLYKSTMANNSDYQLDFYNASQEMNAEQSAWLKNSLTTMFPDGHKWLES